MKVKLLAGVAMAGLFTAGAASADPNGWYGAIDAGYHTADAEGGNHFRRSVAVDVASWEDDKGDFPQRAIDGVHGPTEVLHAARTITDGALHQRCRDGGAEGDGVLGVGVEHQRAVEGGTRIHGSVTSQDVAVPRKGSVGPA